MGTAMVSVMLYHTSIGKFCYLPFPIAEIFLYYGHWGVDIFLFLSGFGICYSLKNDQNNILSFWMRRLCRIMPSCLIVGWVLIALSSSFSYNPETIIKAIGLHEWYIRCILLYYTLSPILAWYFSKINKIKALILIILFSAILTCIVQWMFTNNVCAIRESIFYLFKGTIMFSISRFPAFAFGFYIADNAQWKGSFFSRKTYLITSIISCIVALLGHALAFSGAKYGCYFRFLSYVFLAVSIPLILWTAIHSLQFFPKLICKLLVWIGMYSLEIFLLHNIIFQWINSYHICNDNCFIYIILSFSLSFLSAYILRKIIHTSKYLRKR